MSRQLLPIAVTEIVAALERESEAPGGAIQQWSAAQYLRRMKDYDRRTLVCWVETEPVSETIGVTT